MSAVLDRYADLIGKPFELGGRGPRSYDCYGLAMEVARRNGIDLPAETSISAVETMAAVIKSGKPDYEKCECQPLCGVSFRLRSREPAHLGVVLEDGIHFIHTTSRTAVSIQRLDKWKNRIDGFYSYVG